MSDYGDSGFDSFLSRSIDDLQQTNLDSQGPFSTATAYDRSQLSGSMGDIYKMGGIKMSAKDSTITLNDGSIVINSSDSNDTITIQNGLIAFADINGLNFKVGALNSGSMGNSIVDSSGFTLYKQDGQTSFWYDKNTGKNIMQVGLLPDNTYGWVVAQTGKDVLDGFL